MITTTQLLKGSRKKRFKKIRKPKLAQCPQKKGICRKVFFVNPKKPNSAIRKITRVWFPSTDRRAICYIPGVGHNLQVWSTVLIQGGRVRDIPGMRYRVIRGQFDAIACWNRTRSRSRYGVKRISDELRAKYLGPD